MNQKDYWNSVADNRNFTTTFQQDAFSKYVDKDAEILDVGCGYGRTMNELYHAGYKHLIGVDSACEMLNRGRKEYPYLNFLQNDTLLPFDDNRFDAVILFGVLTSVVDDASQNLLIKEIHRVLKTNGIIYVNDFLINNHFPYKLKYKKYVRKFHTYGIYQLDDGGILRHHDEKYILDLLSCFHTLAYEPVKFKTTGGNVSNGFYFIGEKDV